MFANASAQTWLAKVSQTVGLTSGHSRRGCFNENQPLENSQLFQPLSGDRVSPRHCMNRRCKNSSWNFQVNRRTLHPFRLEFVESRPWSMNLLRKFFRELRYRLSFLNNSRIVWFLLLFWNCEMNAVLWKVPKLNFNFIRIL